MQFAQRCSYNSGSIMLEDDDHDDEQYCRGAVYCPSDNDLFVNKWTEQIMKKKKSSSKYDHVAFVNKETEQRDKKEAAAAPPNMI